jgi:hypothetical protein
MTRRWKITRTVIVDGRTLGINSLGYLVDTSSGRMIHREVFKKHYGRIPIGWLVHHVNHDKQDNRIENLIAVPEHFHNKLHQSKSRLSRAETIERLQKYILQYVTNLTALLEAEAKLEEKYGDVIREYNQIRRSLAPMDRRFTRTLGDIDVSYLQELEKPLPISEPSILQSKTRDGTKTRVFVLKKPLTNKMIIQEAKKIALLHGCSPRQAYFFAVSSLTKENGESVSV